MIKCNRCEEDIPDAVESFFGGALEGWCTCDRCISDLEQSRIDEERRSAGDAYASRVKAQKSAIPYQDSQLSQANHRLLRQVGEAGFKASRLASKGIYVWGGAGLWKTRSAAFCAILATERGNSVCWKSVPKMLTEYTRATMTDQEAAGRFISDMTSTDLLVLDDWGRGVLTPRGLELLFLVIDDRFLNRRATWYTSNAPPSNIGKWIKYDDLNYKEAILRRITEGTTEIKA